MRLRKLGLIVVALGLALPVCATDRPGSISGHVRSSAGVPQMGAAVEILGSAARSIKVFTDGNGFYSAAGLLPGIYTVKVSAPSFLPSLRDRIGLRAGASSVINVTLNTLFEAVQLAPGRPQSSDDDWKWVLRSASNRPILRMLDDGTAVVASSESDNHEVTGKLSFLAGSASQGYGSTSDMSTGFSVEKSMFSTGLMSLEGNVGYGSGSPAAVLRASYSHRLENGSEPQVALTMRRLGSPDVNLHNASLEALALTTSDHFTLGDVLEVKVGSELQTIQFMGRVSAFRPFGSADLHLSPNTVVEYRYASSQPDTREEKGFDSAPSDLSESGPRVSIAHFSPTVEHARHQELSVSRKLGSKTNVQFAVYSDRVTNPALTGVGDLSSVGGQVLPDLYSDTFTYHGADLDTHGLRVVLQRKLNSDLMATLDYGYGGVLDLENNNAAISNARHWMTTQNRHALAAKLTGQLPGAKTHWIASYGWVSDRGLTPVDMFNASAGRSDTYLNLFLRQPIPGTSFLPARMEALVDLRNLLAQGYVPVLSQDGRTVYLVQSARSIRGGVAFIF